ncbi:MAG: acyl carrier protein, partial [Symploca sp. SIO1A3]|nr:acyl carrier protein [Symploca sp. SIO1A3]
MNIKTTEQIQNWLVSYIADLLEISPNEVDLTTPFDRYGLDSSSVVGLTAELG